MSKNITDEEIEKFNKKTEEYYFKVSENFIRTLINSLTICPAVSIIIYFLLKFSENLNYLGFRDLSSIYGVNAVITWGFFMVSLSIFTFLEMDDE